MSDRNQLLAELGQRQVNFQAGELPEVASDPWHVDDYCRRLPSEQPGEPASGGSFEIAEGLMRTYAFADPRMVRAFYRPEAPLLGRDMLLEIRFYFIRVFTGVRVSQIFDEVRESDDGPVRVWGWAYQTLAGHLEKGQMDYQVWKWMDSGRVEFRIHAVSQLLGSPNPVINLGFSVVGRREQRRFARRCGERMERFVSRELNAAARATPSTPTPR